MAKSFRSVVLLAALASQGHAPAAAVKIVTVAAGTDLQATIDANPPGTTFLLAAGNWHRQAIRPKKDDRFVGAEDGRTILTGDDVTAELANAGSGLVGAGVLFRRITVEHYVPGFQQGAISGVVGWTFEDCTFEHMGNSGNGLNPGADSRIIRGRFRYNAGNGIAASHADNLVIEGAEIAYNNTAHLDVDNDTGGLKITASRNVRITNNVIHDNYGDGIWSDVHATNWMISGNTIADNSYNGIHWETSSGATISGNVITGNGAGKGMPMEGAAIYISSSADASVFGNTIVVPDGADGIIMQTIGRPDQVITENNRVQYNSVTFMGPAGLNGWRSYRGGRVGRGNSFDYNRYTSARASDAHWVWGGRNAAMDWNAYRATSGQDAGAQFMAAPTVMNAAGSSTAP